MASLDGAPYTIGSGSTGPNVVPGLVWTQQQATDDLIHRLTYEFAPGVQQAVTVELSAQQMGACVDFTYQEGVKAFAGSTLCKLINANQMTEAADAFLVWDVAGGHVVEGILERRQADRALFLEGTS
jgi:lysozyme